MADEGYRDFTRPPRIQRMFPTGNVEIPTPPDPQFKGTTLDWLILLMPIGLAVLTLVSMILLSVLRPGSNILLVLASVVVSLGFAVTSVINLVQRLSNDKYNKREFSQQLDQTEAELQSKLVEQQDFLNYTHPNLAQLFSWPQSVPPSPRMWERRPQDSDFLRLRLGRGNRASTVTVNFMAGQRNTPLVQRARQVANNYQTVPDVPQTTDLFDVCYLGICGDTATVTPFSHALLCHLTALHSPDDVKLVVTHAPHRSHEWFWLGWLPHMVRLVYSGTEIPMIASQPNQLEILSSLLLEQIKQRKLIRHNSGTSTSENRVRRKAGYMFPVILWVVENPDLVSNSPAWRQVLQEGAELGIFVLVLADSLMSLPECQAIAEVRPNGRVAYSVVGENGLKFEVEPELARLEDCEQYALAMASWQPKAASTSGNLPQTERLLDFDEFHTEPNIIPDPLPHWLKSSNVQLELPIGRIFGGQERVLNIKEHGPHGLLAGTTGSGKSELLLTLVSALALKNHPDNLNLILGDFKGGATFNPFRELPHVVGMLSDLDLPMVERAMTAVTAEIKRREHMLREAGVPNIGEYYQKGLNKTGEPMPYLLMIIDEFAEMNEQAPDFMEKIDSIARTGRTLGVHLILATQRPAGIVKGQLNANLKFRVCLRVETPEDSVDMLGRKDAYLIPNSAKGRAFFKVGNDIFEEFQVARVATPFYKQSSGQSSEQPVVNQIDRRSWLPVPLTDRPIILTSRRGTGQLILPGNSESATKKDHDIITEACIQAARKTPRRSHHKPWLDPLGKRYYLTDPAFLGASGFNEDGLHWSEPPCVPPETRDERMTGYGRVPIALLDDVAGQRQYPLYLDLLQQGSYCISGVRQSGKTTLLRTMLMGLALTHAPDRLRFYIFDMGNGLRPFASLPHYTRYVPLMEQNRAGEVFKELYEELRLRQNDFARRGIIKIADFYNQNRITYEQPRSEPPVGIFVAVDNYNVLQQGLSSEAANYLNILIKEGAEFGINLALTMDRAADYNYGRMEAQFYQVVLHQSVDHILSFRVPRGLLSGWESRPGRGFVRGANPKAPLEIQILLPCQGEPENQARLIDRIVAKMNEAKQTNSKWQNLTPPPLTSNPIPGSANTPYANGNGNANWAGAGSNDQIKPDLLNPDIEKLLSRTAEERRSQLIYETWSKPAPTSPVNPSQTVQTNGAAANGTTSAQQVGKVEEKAESAVAPSEDGAPNVNQAEKVAKPKVPTNTQGKLRM